MNLFTLLNRGAAHAPSDADREAAKVAKATEETRDKWLNALMADQCRTWMAIGTDDPGVLDGMTTMLAIAGFAHVYDARSVETPDLRIIRGAMSAAQQCQQRGGQVSVEDARAFSSAAGRAAIIITNCSRDAIVHAATEIRATVGL